MKPSPKKFYFSADERTESATEYQHATIRIYSRDPEDSIPRRFISDPLCEISYQRHQEKDGQYNPWYGERITDMDVRLDYTQQLTDILRKIDREQDKISRQGLALQSCTNGGQYERMITWLKRIGLTRIYSIKDESGSLVYSLDPCVMEV